jgi:hypothetical protein
LAVSRASGPFFTFCAPGLVFGGTRASGFVFMFCAPGLIFDGTEGVRSRFQVLRSPTHFLRFRGRRVPFSCFVLPDSFSAIPRVSGLVFMFCALGFVFGGAECIRSRFHVLCARTHFLRYRGRRVPFSCFALPDSFSTVPRASGPVFMFCAPELIFGRIEGIGSCFHILPARTRFRRCRGRRVMFSCFALLDSFSAVLRASGPFLMFCAPGLVLDGTEGDRSRFHPLRARTRFRRYRGRPVPFSSFARSNSFLAVSRALGPFLKLCAFRLIFVNTEYVGSHFHLLRSRIRFRQCRVRQVPFTCFVLPKSFSAVSSASGPVFMFCAPGLVFGGAECVWSVFMFCAPVLIFDCTEGVGSHFYVLCARTHFRRYRGRCVPFSYFALPDSFSVVPRALGPFFKFCASGLVFGGNEGVGFRYRGRRDPFSCFRSRTLFQRYRLRRVLFSCFARPNSFSAVPRASFPIFMYYAPVLVFYCCSVSGPVFMFCAP